MTDRQKIWITRAQPAAEETAARVRALGHDVLVAPLLEVRRLDVRPDLKGVGALAFTSANGVRAFAAVSPERDLQVFAVGSATSRAARAVGFRQILSADGDVAVLASGILTRRREFSGAVLHAGTTEPAGNLAGALSKHGVETRELFLYETVPAVLTSAVLERLPEMDAALLHSAKAAQALADLLADHPLPRLRALCLSRSVMKPLAHALISAKVFAPMPLEAALLNLIDR